MYIPASSKRCIFSVFSGRIVFHPKCIYFWLWAVACLSEMSTYLCFWNGVFTRPKGFFSRPYFFDILWSLANLFFSAKKNWAETTKISVVSNKSRHFASLEVPGMIISPFGCRIVVYQSGLFFVDRAAELLICHWLTTAIYSLIYYI